MHATLPAKTHLFFSLSALGFALSTTACGVVLSSADAPRGIASPSSDAATAMASTQRTKDSAQRTVLITGANRGLGLEFAKEYAAARWIVIATAREPEAAKDLTALGERVRVLALDVTRAESVAALAKTLKGEAIDVLINNAGVGAGSNGGKSLEAVDVGEFVHVLDVNAVGPVRVTQALLPNLRIGNGKTIVGISSSLGSIGGNQQGGYWGYRESKAALDMFMRSASADLKEAGFICVVIDPGWVKTDMGGPNAQLTPEESVTGMRKVIDGLKPADSGKFWRHDGTNLPW